MGTHDKGYIVGVIIVVVFLMAVLNIGLASADDLCTPCAGTIHGLCIDNGSKEKGGTCVAYDSDDDGVRDDCRCEYPTKVPAITPLSFLLALLSLLGLGAIAMRKMYKR